MGEPCEIPGFVLFQPKDLRCGEAWKNVVAREVDHGGGSTKGGADFVALGSGRGIAPEFGRANDLVIGIERHEAVLLTGNADAHNLGFAGAEVGEDLAHGLLEGIPPNGGILLEVAGGQSLHQAVGFAGGGDDFSGVAIEGDRFQTLGAAVDAESDHRSSLRMFSRYSWPPLSSVGAGCESASCSSSANEALPARIFFPRSEFHEA